MYAIVDIAGQQLKLQKNQKIYVNRLVGNEGSNVYFDRILLIDDEGKVQVGTPVVENMVVTAMIVSHLKGDKIKVFKKKRRKGYKVLNGHRQLLTELLISSISSGKAKPIAKVKTEKKEETKVKTQDKSKAEKKPIATKEKEAKPKSALKTTQQAKANQPAAAKSTAVKKENTTKSVLKPKSPTVKKDTKTGSKPTSAATKKPQTLTAKKVDPKKPKA